VIAAIHPVTDPYSSAVDQYVVALARWAVADARLGLISLMHSFGSPTEPDFRAIAPVYNRVLAMSLLLVGAVIALALIERVAGGGTGIGWSVVPRVIAAVFFAYSGLGLLEYMAGYAALIATIWSPDLSSVAAALGGNAPDPSVAAAGTHPVAHVPHINLVGLIATALMLNLLALLVYLELVIRSALILLLAAFIPFVCVLSIWPRMAGSATQLAEFLIGLLLSKFVVATAVYVGFSLVLPGLVSADPGGWMANGLAILLIAACSPLVIFQALRFAHGAAGNLARGWTISGVSLVRWGSAARLLRLAFRHPQVSRIGQSLHESIPAGSVAKTVTVGRARAPTSPIVLGAAGCGDHAPHRDPTGEQATRCRPIPARRRHGTTAAARGGGRTCTRNWPNQGLRADGQRSIASSAVGTRGSCAHRGAASLGRRASRPANLRPDCRVGRAALGRRGRGEGTIRRRDDGRWEGRADLGYKNGKRSRRSVYGRTRREVQQRIAQLAREAREGSIHFGSIPKAGEFLTQWAEVSAVRVRPKTATSYEGIVRLHLRPALGEVRIDKLAPEHVEELMKTKLSSGLSPTSVLRILQVLRIALNRAVRTGLLTRNVAQLVDPPRVPRREVGYLTKEQARQLLEQVQGHRLEALITLALSTGLRQGEALGLRWGDVDLELGSVRVVHALQRIPGGGLALVEPKTSRSRRTLILPAVTLRVLREHKKRQASLRFLAGTRWQESNFVFTSNIGSPLDGNNVTRDFQAALRLAGLPRIRFHDLRHSAATLLLVQGVPARVVMEILGHSQITMTLNTYSHVPTALTREAARAMDRALSKEQGLGERSF
jgi:integrase